jgi:hypothetical protein
LGWRGTIRALGAISRAAERDSRRRAREHAKHLVAAQKSALREKAAEVVRLHEEYVTSLTSAHHSCSEVIDWKQRAAAPAPAVPERPRRREEAARQRLAAFRPSTWTRLRGRVDEERGQLEEAIGTAIADDIEAHKIALQHHATELETHRDDKDLAEHVLAGDTEAMLEFLKVHDPFGSVATLGESLRVALPNPRCVAVAVDVHSEDVIPKEIPRLLKSGQLSLKPMPKGDYHRLYQDHVSSSVLRVAAEILAALPVEAVVVTAVDDLLDPGTGHLKSTPILSVAIPRATLRQLNLARVDPSDALRNFKREMDFGATVGFREVEPLDPDAIVTSA